MGREMREGVTAAFASAALAFFNLALQASRSRRRFCRILRSFWKGQEMGQSRLLRSRVEEGTWYHLGIKSISLSKHAREKKPVAMLISLAGVLGLVARDTG